MTHRQSRVCRKVVSRTECCGAMTVRHCKSGSKYCVHAQVVALTTAIGVLKGTGSEAFAVGLVFSLVVSPSTTLNTQQTP